METIQTGEILTYYPLDFVTLAGVQNWDTNKFANYVSNEMFAASRVLEKTSSIDLAFKLAERHVLMAYASAVFFGSVEGLILFSAEYACLDPRFKMKLAHVGIPIMYSRSGMVQYQTRAVQGLCTEGSLSDVAMKCWRHYNALALQDRAGLIYIDRSIAECFIPSNDVFKNRFTAVLGHILSLLTACHTVKQIELHRKEHKLHL